MFINNEHQQIAELEFRALDYQSPCDFASAYTASLLLSKYKKLKLPFDKKKRAMEKFQKFEISCRETNIRFNNLALDPLFKGPSVWLHEVVKQKIAGLLGEFDVQEFFSMADWGPGASTLIKRRDASSPTKFQLETGITRDLSALLPMQLLSAVYPHWAQHLENSDSYPNYQVGNKVITVPKNAAIDRVIAVEPGLNLFFQKSVGKMIEKRLSRVGIDLHDQGINQKLAQSGSNSGLLATIDFSSASDSISFAVVRELLPYSWFRVLDTLRSHFGLVDGKWTRWNKFSSMGNGFTFQLESLIFWAIAKAVTQYLDINLPVGVYGDDVVVATAAVPLFSKMSEFYGFTFNPVKSFFSTGFRESCGAHFYLGRDVKPVYLKDELRDISSVYSFANAIRLYASRRCCGVACDSAFRKVFALLVRVVPSSLRLRVPQSSGDVGFISNFDEACPRLIRGGHEGYRVYTLAKRRRTVYYEQFGLLLSKLWFVSSSTNLDGTSRLEFVREDELRGPTLFETNGKLKDLGSSIERGNSVALGNLEFQLVVSNVRQWEDLGPWV